MTLQTIYIARHGFRSNWLPQPHPPNPTGIDSDPALAPHGEDQAVELATYVKSLPEPPQFIVSSPFYRCVQTSAQVAAQLDLKVTIDRGIGEWFKTNRDIVPVPANYDQLRSFFEDTLGDHNAWDGAGVIPSSEGETEEDVYSRCNTFWGKFIPKFEAQYPDIKSIIFITHAATKIALGMNLLRCQSLNQDIEFNGEATKLRAGACSLDKFVLIDGHWDIKENGRTDFLKDGEEMNWNFDVRFEAGSDEDIQARRLAQGGTGSGEDGFEDLHFTIDIPITSSSYYEETRDLLKNNDGSLLSEKLIINPGAKFQITELDHDTPLYKFSDNAPVSNDPNSHMISNLRAIDGQIYKTSWARLLGTELIVDDYGELIGTVREHLLTNSASRIIPESADDEIDFSILEDLDAKTTFFKRALAAAKKKE